MKRNVIEPKKEKLNIQSKNSILLSTRLLFKKNIKLDKNKKTNTSREKKDNNKTEKNSKDKIRKNNQKRIKQNDKKDLRKISEINLFRSSGKMNLLFIDKIIEQKKRYISKHNSNNNFKNKINFTHPNKFKTDFNKKLISFREPSKYKTKTCDTTSNEKSKKKEYKAENIFNYPIKYLNNSIDLNNNITNNKVNYLGNLDIIKRNSSNNNKENKSKKKDNIFKKNNFGKKSNDKKKKFHKVQSNKYTKKISKYKLLKKILSKESIIDHNDTEVKYINNDKEEITESYNEKETKIKFINEDLDKFLKIVDTLNTEDEYDGNNISNFFYFDENKQKKIVFDDELSSISSQPKKQINKKINKNNIKDVNKSKNNNKIKSKIKLEIKKNNKHNNNEEIKLKEKNEKNINNSNKINNELKNDKNIKHNKLNKKSFISDKFQVKINEESTFNNLLDNNTFKKFIQNKIRYYIDGKEIPKNFLNSLSISKKKKLKNKSEKNLDSLKGHFLTTDRFYDSSKNEIKNNNNIIIKDDENERDYFGENKNNKNLIYNTNYEKLENDNLKKSKEIQSLKEELKNQKLINNEKKEIINELQNINHNLENQVNNLKYKYYLGKNIGKYNNLSDLNLDEENKKYDFLLNKYKIVNNLKYKEPKFKEKIYNEDNNLNYNELIQKKNILIQIRKKINNKYFNLSDKKENQKYKDILENKLDKINNSLLKIRTRLNNFKY